MINIKPLPIDKTSLIISKLKIRKINLAIIIYTNIIAMTRSLALEFAPKNINLSCICPGAIKTVMTKVIEENEMMLKQTLTSIPAGRMGDPIDIANAALYQASDESGYVTGASIVVDGGRSVH
ncbi:MAG TPA: SDR family oxidoreductase [Nitrososphaeraceae archaeon]|nr:SDR family oxidoreductase [Nitrososphaeraceae archaeon]